MELGMKEPYTEGVAIHCGPEPCGGIRKNAAEALDRGKRRPGIELRNHHSGVPTLLPEREGHTMCSVKRKLHTDPAESKTLRMRGNSMHENREIPSVPDVEEHPGRPGKATSHTSGMYAPGKSDKPIVPVKPPNKVSREAGRRRRWREGV